MSYEVGGVENEEVMNVGNEYENVKRLKLRQVVGVAKIARLQEGMQLNNMFSCTYLQ
jgi:hypothetical protein